MKKLIAILAVFAVVAGAAFAKGAVDPDGTWGEVSLSTNGAIGSDVDIKNGTTTSKGWESSSDFTNYSLGLSYSWNILTAELKFKQNGMEHSLSVGNDDISAKITGNFTGNRILDAAYDGFEISASHEEEWGSVEFEYKDTFAGSDPDKLWGSFSIYNSLFKGVYVDGGDEDYWFLGDAVFGGNVAKMANGGFVFNHDLGGVVEGLEAGLYVPKLFLTAAPQENVFLNTVYGLKYDGGDIKLAFQVFGYVPGFRFQASLLDILDFDVIIRNFDPFDMSLGAKISSPEIELGADATLNAWAKFLSHDKFDTINLSAEATLGYSAEPLGAELVFGFTGKITDDFDGSIAIKPSVWYDIDPDHLRAKVSAGFTIPFADGALISWSLKPELIYNFYGGGFGDFEKKNDDSDVKMGMYLAYAIDGTLGDNGAIGNNKVTLGMKWSF